jgi:hypothetical protein
LYARSGGENILRRNFSLSSQENIATGGERQKKFSLG